MGSRDNTHRPVFVVEFEVGSVVHCPLSVTRAERGLSVGSVCGT